ncbi:metalloendoproteinase 3-MMP-like [Iris pallida]|uniref:Metalloendoproteinase 3-MMP-like n=1 Tax=Iris pallida TaxID=29817 RepID=A0AAX6GSL6_IRIPA|nr:metalloendoproteinase 3-MMP-like [Iris pallida]
MSLYSLSSSSTLLACSTLLILLSWTAPSTSAFSLSDLSSTSPWSAFLNLTGCHLGDRNPVLPTLKNYLHHFGYLPDSVDLSDDSFDDILESALRTYQQNFALDATGHLDLRTIAQLASPRCGVPDIVNGTTSMIAGRIHGRGLYTYFQGEPTWPQRDLTYAFTDVSAVSIDRSVLGAVFGRAFARWAAATPLTFKEVAADAGADITIGFFKGDHGDGEPFDGVLGTLAHAFSPTNGRFHLDAAENWVAEGDVRDSNSRDAVDLESVAVHEIGHLLGMGHSSAADAVMFPTISAGSRRVDLASDDVEGVQRLYGSNPDFRKAMAPTGGERQQRDSSHGEVGLERLGWGAAVGLFLAVVTVNLLDL